MTKKLITACAVAMVACAALAQSPTPSTEVVRFAGTGTSYVAIMKDGTITQTGSSGASGAVAATTLSASGAATLRGSVTVVGGGVTQRWDNASGKIDTAALEVGPVVSTEVTSDGKYAVTGGDATTGLMIQKAARTAGTNATETIAFAVVFGAAPIVTCTYTEDPGDVRPIFVTSVTASNFVANITADKNYGYVAVGTRP